MRAVVPSVERAHDAHAGLAEEAVLLAKATYGRAVLSLKRGWGGFVLSVCEDGREVFSRFTTNLEEALVEFRAALTTMRLEPLRSRCR
jgi:hypothetical protein